jgi:hypothetical protein
MDAMSRWPKLDTREATSEALQHGIQTELKDSPGAAAGELQIVGLPIGAQAIGC